FANISDWRRDNVNQMVADVMDTIMQVNPHVRFGISPFGIYTQYVPEGIAASLDAYNTLYIDPIQWLSSGSIDYLNPQLYWHIGSSWDYSLLLPWWAEQALTYNRHLIAGHAIYKLVLDPSARIAEYDLHEYKDYFNFTESEARLQERTWLSLSEISNQIDIVRENRDQNAMGSAFFRYQDFIVVDGLAEHIVTHNYNNPATLPPMTWKSAIIPDPPNNIRWDVDGQGASFITWDVANDNDRYVLYASSEPSPPAGFIDDPANIVKILYDNTFYLEGSEITGKPNLFFTTYDRYGNESATATMFAIDAPSTASTLQTPINLAVNQAFNFDFSWTSVDQAQSYLLEVSSTSDFQSIEFSTSVAAITFNASEFALLGEQEYYWRITPLNAAGSGPGSDVFSFTSGFPANAVITAPADGEQYVDLSPLVQWGTNTVATSVKLQIAKGGSQFLEYNIIIDKDLGAVGEYQLTETLTEWTTHYMRIKLINSLGESHWTYSDFKTLMIVPAAPIIYAPDQDQNFEPSDPVEIKWGKTSKATGYQIDLSTDIDRTNVIESDKKYSYSDTTIVYNNLLEGEYYANVAGTNIGGTGAWSQVKFIIEHVVGINDKELDNKRLSVSYLNKSELILGIDATGLKIYNLKMYDLYGHELVLPESTKQGAIENYVLNRNILPPFSIVILESTEGVEYVKIIGR
ncbi:MAG: family 10 glycosylhydrolase, partial [Bacteroidota bacterium]